jgi:cell shape-determining protein MreC
MDDAIRLTCNKCGNEITLKIKDLARLKEENFLLKETLSIIDYNTFVLKLENKRLKALCDMSLGKDQVKEILKNNFIMTGGI